MRLRFKNRPALIQAVERLDADDQGLSRALKLMAAEFEGEADEFRQLVSRTFGIGRPTFERWLNGVNRPHPLALAGIVKDGLLELVRGNRS